MWAEGFVDGRPAVESAVSCDHGAMVSDGHNVVKCQTCDARYYIVAREVRINGKVENGDIDFEGNARRMAQSFEYDSTRPLGMRFQFSAKDSHRADAYAYFIPQRSSLISDVESVTLEEYRGDPRAAVRVQSGDAANDPEQFGGDEYRSDGVRLDDIRYGGHARSFAAYCFHFECTTIGVRFCGGVAFGIILKCDACGYVARYVGGKGVQPSDILRIAELGIRKVSRGPTFASPWIDRSRV